MQHGFIKEGNLNRYCPSFYHMRTVGRSTGRQLLKGHPILSIRFFFAVFSEVPPPPPSFNTMLEIFNFGRIDGQTYET